MREEERIRRCRSATTSGRTTRSGAVLSVTRRRTEAGSGAVRGPFAASGRRRAARRYNGPTMRPLVSLLLLTAVALGQEPSPPPPDDPASVLALLRSKAPAEAAWGAHLAGRTGLRDAVPLLLELLPPRPAAEAKEWRFVHAAVLDALVRLEARVPAAVLRSHLGTANAAAALVLIARDPEEGRETLLAVLPEWLSPRLSAPAVAAGNLLARTRTRGLAFLLLSRWTIDLTVTVTDQPDLFFGGSASASISCGDGRLEVPEGFPPHAWYEASFRKGEGAAVLADGPTPVYVTRQERPERRIGVGAVSAFVDYRETATAWLAMLLGGKEAVPDLPGDESETVFFQGADHLLGVVEALRERLAARFAAGAQAFVEKGLLTAEEAAGLSPPLAVALRDCRQDTEEPLPEMPAGPAK